MFRGGHSARALAACLLIPGLALAGCAGNRPGPSTPVPASSAGQTTGPAPASTSGATQSTPGTASALTPTTTGSGDDSGPPIPTTGAGFAVTPTGNGSYGAGELVLTQLRTGVHEGFDRVVLEWSGSGTPGWSAELTTKATDQASGEALPITGPSYLLVTVHGANYEYDRIGRRTTTAGSHPVLWNGVFEATGQLVIGLPRPTPYRAWLLTEPTRLVIDIQR